MSLKNTPIRDMSPSIIKLYICDLNLLLIRNMLFSLVSPISYSFLFYPIYSQLKFSFCPCLIDRPNGINLYIRQQPLRPSLLSQDQTSKQRKAGDEVSSRPWCPIPSAANGLRWPPGAALTSSSVKLIFDD